MAEVNVRSTRPDVDIANDIYDILVRTPQLSQDRQHVRIQVTGGVAVLRGHMRSPMNRRFFVERVALVPDVTRVEASELYTEEDIRLAAGGLVPEGVIVNVRYGTVILNGDLPTDGSLNEISANLAQIPGVDRVIAAQS